MILKRTKLYLWLWAVVHAYTIAQQHAVMCNALRKVNNINEQTRNGKLVRMRGSLKGWRGTIGDPEHPEMDINATSFQNLLDAMGAPVIDVPTK